MENVYFDVETDSTVDNVLDPSDHTDARAPDNVQEPILVESLNALTAGLQTDAQPRMQVNIQRASSSWRTLHPISPVQPPKLRLATSSRSSQRWIRAGLRTLVRIHWCPEPCLWTKVVTAEGSWEV